MARKTTPKRKVDLDGIYDYFMIEAQKWGVDEITASAIARLGRYAAGGKLRAKEREKWVRLGLLTEKGSITMEDPSSPLEWVVAALAWQGKIKREKVLVKK